MPYIFWWALAVLFVWRYLFVTLKARSALIWAGVFAGLSLATKDQIAGALVGLGLAILFIQPEGQTLAWGQRGKNTLLFGLCAAGAYFLFAIAPHPARWWYHLSLWTLDSPGVLPFVAYPATLSGYIALLGAVLRNLTVLLSPVGILLVIVGFGVWIRSKQANRTLFFLLPALTYIFIIIMSIRFVYERFMLPVAVVMVPVAGVGAGYLTGHASQLIRRSALAMVLFGVVFQVFVGYLPVTSMQLYDVKRQLAETLDHYVPPGSPLLVELNGAPSFPNAAVYTHYKLMLPEGKKPNFRAEEHLFADFAPGAHCLLSANPLDESARGVERVASWKNPAYVSRFVMKQLLLEFYLYDIDGKCQELD
jgi:hypothetical protein